MATHPELAPEKQRDVCQLTLLEVSRTLPSARYSGSITRLFGPILYREKEVQKLRFRPLAGTAGAQQGTFTERAKTSAVSLPRRTYFRALPMLAIPFVSGCSRSSESPSVRFSRIRVVNLSETELSIELIASRETEPSVRLYEGSIGVRGANPGDGELVLQPSEITEPLQYEYRLLISSVERAALPSELLTSAYQREAADHPVACVEFSFAIRNPANDSKVWADYTFRETCDTASRTADPAASSRTANGIERSVPQNPE